jgi:hypothetical protein
MSNESKLIEAAKALCAEVKAAYFGDTHRRLRLLATELHLAIGLYQPEPVITAEHWQSAFAVTRFAARNGGENAAAVHAKARELAIESRNPKFTADQMREKAKLFRTITGNNEVAAMLEQAADQLSKPA